MPVLSTNLKISNDRHMRVSFIIPAFNEEECIAETITSIVTFGCARDAFTTEIILVDNGSTDKTAAIAEGLGARVIIQHDVTVAALRNIGASQASGDIFIFLDADVLLTQSWSQNIDEVLSELFENESLITGSHTAPPSSNNWFLKYWFRSFADEESSEHIGSAHMMLSRQLFQKLQGFDKNLITAEDYDLCQRARKQGASIINNKDLAVIHTDYPLSIFDFMAREAWHGMGDCMSLNSAVRSKSLVASLLYVSLLSSLGYSVFEGNTLTSVISVLLLMALLLLSAWVKYNHSGRLFVIINALIFNVYYFGRFLSIFRCIQQRIKTLRNTF
jgi:glycosyltransferase involved in cell wall biosynthesis